MKDFYASINLNNLWLTGLNINPIDGTSAISLDYADNTYRGISDAYYYADTTSLIISGLLTLGGGSLASSRVIELGDYGGTGNGFARIEGIQARPSNSELTLINTSATTVYCLVPEVTGQTAANRMSLRNNSAVFLLPGDSITLWYSDTFSRWLLAKLDSSVISPAADDILINEDFRGRVTSGTAGVVGSMSLAAAGTSAAVSSSSVGLNSTEKTNGVVSLATGTTATGRAGVWEGNAIDNNLGSETFGMFFLARVNVGTTLSNATNRFAKWLGFIDSPAAANIVDGVGFAYEDQNSANWQAVVANNSTFTRVPTSLVVTVNSWVWLGVYVNPSFTKASFFGGSSLGTLAYLTEITTNLPTGARAFQVGCKTENSVGTLSRTSYIDKIISLVRRSPNV